MYDDFSFINTASKSLNLLKKCFISQDGWEKLHTREFQLKGMDGNMRYKLLQKKFSRITKESSKHLWHFTIEKDIFSELNRCIFQISLKYIKLVIPEILFRLVLYNFNFYFKIMWPPPPPLQQNSPSKIKISDLTPPAKTFLKFFNPFPSWRGRGVCHA